MKLRYLMIFLSMFFLDELGAQDLLIKSGKVFDSRKGRWKNVHSILIHSGRIKEINAKKWPANTQVLNFEKFFIIPGLIDSHTHIFLDDPTLGEDFSKGLLSFVQKSTNSSRLELGLNRANSLLRHGFTSIRDLGNSGGVENDFIKKEINFYTSGAGYVPKDGQFPKGTSERIIFKEYLPMTDQELFKLDLKKGLVKLYADEDPNPAITTLDLMKKWVKRSHELKLKVSAHAIYSEAIQSALDATADSVEHGYNVTDQQISQMVQQKTFWVPTVGMRVLMLPQLKSVMPKYLPGELAKICGKIMKAKRAGVKIVFGSDNYFSIEKFGISFGDATIESLIYLGNCGLSPGEVLKSATFSGSELIGDPTIGTIEVGSKADFVIYKDDPLKDLQVLKWPFKVYSKGIQVFSKPN